MESAVIVLLLRIALAVVLYAFLAWALWVLWADLRAHGRARTAAPAPPPLELLEPGGERSGRFTVPQVVLGRDPACEHPLADSTVSARHARLSYHHGQWWAQDLGSRNGTFLNDRRVSEPAALADGDELRCGQLAFTIRLGRSGGTRAPAAQDNDLA